MKPEHELIQKAEQIEDLIWQMADIIQKNFPDQYANAYQHWIPQILTGLFDYPQWLNRGVFNLNNTLLSICDSKDNTKGLTKVI